MQLADKIRIIRKARGLSQEGLGYSLSRVSKNGVSRQAVSDWENGKSEPCLENIRDLAEVLGVSFDALLDESIDLDQPEVLNAILSKQKYITYEFDEKQQGNIERSIYYTIKTNALTVKKFAITIFACSCLILTVIFGGLISLYKWAAIPTYVVGLLGLGFLIISITNNIIPALKGKIYHSAGHLSYNSLSIDDKYITMEGYQNMNNTLYIEIDKIVEINLYGKLKQRHGDVAVVIENKEHPMIIVDVLNPNDLISTFKKIKEYK